MGGYKGTHLRFYLITVNLGLKIMTVINYPLCASATLLILSSLSQTLSKDCYLSVSKGVTFNKKKGGREG